MSYIPTLTLETLTLVVSPTRNVGSNITSSRSDYTISPRDVDYITPPRNPVNSSRSFVPNSAYEMRQTSNHGGNPDVNIQLDLNSGGTTMVPPTNDEPHTSHNGQTGGQHGSTIVQTRTWTQVKARV
ncbi:hypothetical protein Dimus_003159 [Dionaea muscipula]